MLIKEHKKRNGEDFKKFLIEKDLNKNYLEWCKWAGWIDTDGSLDILKHKNKKRSDQVRVRLKLKDRQPVELLGDFFETNLTYTECKTITPLPYQKTYIAKTFSTHIYGEKANCLVKNIYPYLVNERKKQEAVRILGYTPKSKPLDDWTKDEIISYLATVIEGDGSIQLQERKNSLSIILSIKSSTVQYLSDIKYLIDTNFNTCLTLREHSTYKTKKGIKTKYDLFLNKSHMEIFKMLIKDNIMTLDRKKNKIIKYLSQRRFHNILN
tara:strand:+ start:62 stop:862 length:801 start_codon:yes stop_codon:yes gene_type:complete